MVSHIELYNISMFIAFIFFFPEMMIFIPKHIEYWKHSESADLLGRGRSLLPYCPLVKMLSLGGEKLPPPPPPFPPKKKKKKKSLDHYPHHDLGMLPLLWFYFLLIYSSYPDHHQNLISSSLHYPGPLHKISFQSVNNFLSNVVHRQTDRQTNQRYQKHNLLCQGGNNYHHYSFIRTTLAQNTTIALSVM